MNFRAGFCLASGAFSILGAIFDWDWFMDGPKARFVVRFLGRPGARIFYALLGAGLMVIGGFMAIGRI